MCGRTVNALAGPAMQARVARDSRNNNNRQAQGGNNARGRGGASGAGGGGRRQANPRGNAPRSKNINNDWYTPGGIQASSFHQANNNDDNDSGVVGGDGEAAVAGAQEHQVYRPGFNIGPGRHCPILLIPPGEDDVRLSAMRWGIGNSKDFASIIRTINARDDTIISGGFPWMQARKSRRCVVPVQGFYEWLTPPNATKPNQKKPYFIHVKPNGPLDYNAESTDGQVPDTTSVAKVDVENLPLLYVAGLYQLDKAKEDGSVLGGGFTIVTTSSSEKLRWLHDRMPVILPSWDDCLRWMDTDNYKFEDVQEMLHPHEDEGLVWYQVGNAVGNIRNQGKELCVPVTEAKGSLHKFFSAKPKSAASPDIQMDPPAPISVPLTSSELQPVLPSTAIQQVTPTPDSTKRKAETGYNLEAEVSKKAKTPSSVPPVATPSSKQKSAQAAFQKQTPKNTKMASAKTPKSGKSNSKHKQLPINAFFASK